VKAQPPSGSAVCRKTAPLVGDPPGEGGLALGHETPPGTRRRPFATAFSRNPETVPRRGLGPVNRPCRKRPRRHGCGARPPARRPAPRSGPARAGASTQAARDFDTAGAVARLLACLIFLNSGLEMPNIASARAWARAAPSRPAARPRPRGRPPAPPRAAHAPPRAPLPQSLPCLLSRRRRAGVTRGRRAFCPPRAARTRRPSRQWPQSRSRPPLSPRRGAPQSRQGRPAGASSQACHSALSRPRATR